jgi:hypothetical protein
MKYDQYSYHTLGEKIQYKQKYYHTFASMATNG